MGEIYLELMFKEKLTTEQEDILESFLDTEKYYNNADSVEWTIENQAIGIRYPLDDLSIESKEYYRNEIEKTVKHINEKIGKAIPLYEATIMVTGIVFNESMESNAE